MSNFLSEDGSFEKIFPFLRYGQIKYNTLENMGFDCSYTSIITLKDSSISSPPHTVVLKANTSKLMREFLEYFRRFGHLASFMSDVKGYL